MGTIFEGSKLQEVSKILKDTVYIGYEGRSSGIPSSIAFDSEPVELHKAPEDVFLVVVDKGVLLSGITGSQSGTENYLRGSIVIKLSKKSKDKLVIRGIDPYLVEGESLLYVDLGWLLSKRVDGVIVKVESGNQLVRCSYINNPLVLPVTDIRINYKKVCNNLKYDVTKLIENLEVKNVY